MLTNGLSCRWDLTNGLSCRWDFKIDWIGEIMGFKHFGCLCGGTGMLATAWLLLVSETANA
jgi:hypothetical protein